KPDFAEALKNRGMCRLLAGQYKDGWADYEWRWKAKEFQSKHPDIAAPVWQGEDVAGRNIAVFSEQGLGDIIQFVRYLPELARRHAKVTFFVNVKLIRLFKDLPIELRAFNTSHPGETFDFQCALMSLPLRFGTDVASIPNRTPYLRAERNLATKWKAHIGDSGFRIGIVWQGKADWGRAIPLAEFLPLSRVPGVRLISLQKHHGLDQLAGLPADAGIELLGEDFDAGPDAFVDTAAVMENLDLIITTDTSIAHLAGALGRPVWVALKRVPDWRWMLDRQDSPWYPTMRLFRQQRDGEWKHVFANIQECLR